MLPPGPVVILTTALEFEGVARALDLFELQCRRLGRFPSELGAVRDRCAALAADSRRRLADEWGNNLGESGDLGKQPEQPGCGPVAGTVTAMEAARMLEVTPQAITAAARGLRLPGRRVGPGRRWEFEAGDVAAFADRRSHG